MKTNSFTLLIFLLISKLFSSQESIEFLNFLKGKDSLVDMVLKNHEKYKLQIIYSQLKHHSKDSVEIKNLSLLKQNYFYPASTIKLPCALLALEKLNELKINRNHYFKIDNDKLNDT